MSVHHRTLPASIHCVSLVDTAETVRRAAARTKSARPGIHHRNAGRLRGVVGGGGEADATGTPDGRYSSGVKGIRVRVVVCIGAPPKGR
ncbi:hypothetical protein GCM10022251_37560 [Phytohabitans flavus]